MAPRGRRGALPRSPPSSARRPLQKAAAIPRHFPRIRTQPEVLAQPIAIIQGDRDRLLCQVHNRQFFRVRTWDQDTIIEELLANYDKLDAELRAELPFKRIWSLTTPDEE